MIKSIESYSSTKGTLREEVCSRLIKPTTQVYLGNVGLLTHTTMKWLKIEVDMSSFYIFCNWTHLPTLL
jgi:hypothetical protein